MKNLILENDCEIDIPDELQEVLKGHFVENREIWTHFKEAFWPENRKSTIDRFAALKPDDNVVCQTVFCGYMQLELMIELLHGFISKGIKVNFYIMVAPGLFYHLKKYLSEYESEICPNIWEYDNDYKLRYKFKKEMNKKLYEVLDFHNIYDLERIAMLDFKKGHKKITKSGLKRYKSPWN